MEPGLQAGFYKCGSATEILVISLLIVFVVVEVVILRIGKGSGDRCSDLVRDNAVNCFLFDSDPQGVVRLGVRGLRPRSLDSRVEERAVITVVAAVCCCVFSSWLWFWLW